MELSNDIDFIISSSWDLESKSKNLKTTVTFNDSNKRVVLEDVVQLDTCVHLVRVGEPESKEPCTVKIVFPESTLHLINQVVIVSEARVIELFGACEEYLNTFSAEYVDDFEDCAVYMATCTVKPLRELVIRFQKTKHEDSLWLYGINLRMNSSKSLLPTLSSINFQSVNEILKEAKIPLSETAEKSKAFLQAYGNALDRTQLLLKNQASNPQMLMKMMEAGYFNLGETGRNVSRCVSNFVPFKVENKSTSQDSKGLSSDELALKNYIDKRFTELEIRIDRFEQKMKDIEARQNEKLDCIIALLNKHST